MAGAWCPPQAIGDRGPVYSSPLVRAAGKPTCAIVKLRLNADAWESGFVLFRLLALLVPIANRDRRRIRG
jgi:hypothetical protein